MRAAPASGHLRRLAKQKRYFGTDWPPAHRGFARTGAFRATMRRRQPAAAHEENNMKGNFAALVLVVTGALALAANLGWFEIDLLGLLRTWWPLLLILVGVGLYFTPEPGARKKG
jgi:hypothetical protein